MLVTSERRVVCSVDCRALLMSPLIPARNALATIVEDVRKITGRIDLVHANDSRDAFDSGADRHANLGAGQIDPELLAAVIRDAQAPVVCETPGGAQHHRDDFAWIRERL